MTKPKRYKTPVLLRFTRAIFPVLEKISSFIAIRFFTQLFFTPLRYDYPEKEIPWLNQAKTTTVKIKNKKVVIYEWGQTHNPSILFIHGWAGRATQFRKFYNVFINAGYRIISFDGPAHGKSSGKRTNILEFTETVDAVLKLKGTPEGIISHSFGGTVSLFSIVQKIPIKKLVTIGTPVIGDLLIDSFLKAVNGTVATREGFKKYLLKKYGRSFDEFTAGWLLQKLPNEIDLFIIHDEHDKEVSIQHAEAAAKIYPGATMLRTQGLGHARILKDVKVINSCLEFFRSNLYPS
jgi:pimeloyl-ACP methyl ester carboxylesterase